MKKYIFISILFFASWVYSQPSKKLQQRVHNFCTHDMSNILQNTQYCIQEIDAFLTDIIQRNNKLIGPIDHILGKDILPTYVFHNEIKNKAVHFCIHDPASNIIGSRDECIQKARRFLYLTFRRTEIHEKFFHTHNTFFFTVEDITRDVSFEDSSTWNPGFIDFSLPQFYNYIETTEYCIQDTNALLNKIILITEKINTPNIQSICENLQTFNKYVNCLNAKKEIILDIESLIQSSKNITCPSDSYIDSIITQLQSILHPLQTEYDTLLNARHLIFSRQRTIQQEQINKEVIAKSGPAVCEIDILKTYENILLEYALHNIYTINGNLRSIEQGNLYKLNKAITKCRILHDKILSLAELCHLQDLPIIKDIQQTIDQFEINFENPNIFDQTVKYTCEKLRQNDPGVNLCENPVNSPSWIYSAHYFLKQLSGD